MNKILIKLESLNPTGIPFKMNTLEMILEPNDSIINDKLFLSIGECLYRINEKGYIIERIIPFDNNE